MKSRGFNAVLADFVPDVRRIEVLDAASECGLRAYLTDGDLHYYLLTGKLRDANAVDGLVRSKLGPLLSHRAFAGVAVLGGYLPDRVAVVLAALDAAGVNQLVPGQSGYTASGGAIVAWLDAQRPSIPNVSQVERLYHEYHSEIHAGWNDGLVIDFLPEEAQESAVRAPTPLDSAESPNLATVDSTVFDEILPKEGARSRQFAAESLVRRAQVWGSRLNGCVREPMSLPKEGNPAMTATLFHRDQRRYLFLFNQSSEPVRGTIRLTASSFGTKVARAVEVPSSVHQVAGEVHVARNGELVLKPVLRAGDAILYELF